MSAPRSAPPELAGYTYLDYLGGGGFADVFLYEQHRPRRKVAIKVLRKAVDDTDSEQPFDVEADLMASVSHHPYIVTVYGVGVAPDGRPFLVMAYYPPPHFGERSREKTMPIAEVLRVGIQVASAVETAHRANIIHRDIKPANVLSSEYGEPGLTDFGISMTRTDTALEYSLGLSVAYAPPEIILEESPGDVLTDVYSLAATVYALAVGRSPFDRPGRNDFSEVVHRVLNEAPPSTGRSDMPTGLELVLRQGLSKRPADRHVSALAFARALRDVEQEQRLPPTEIKLAIAGAAPSVSELRSEHDNGIEDQTRHAIQVVDPSGDVKPASRSEPEASALIESAPKSAMRALDPRAHRDQDLNSQTVQRRSRTDEPQPVEPEHILPPRPPSGRRGFAIAAASIAAALVAVIGIGTTLGSHRGNSATTTSVDPGAGGPLDDFPPMPTVVEATAQPGARETAITVRWQPGPGSRKTDTYWVVPSPKGTLEPVSTAQGATSATFHLPFNGVACFYVEAHRGQNFSDKQAEPSCPVAVLPPSATTTIPPA